MQCLSQLITKEQTHLSKIWDTVQHVEKRMRSYLSGLRINITLTFMSFSSYLVHAISCSNNTAKISPFVMFIIFFLFLVSPFYFYFLFFTAWPTTRHALPVTRYPLPIYPLPVYPLPVYPLPVTRHLRKSPADFCSGLRLYRSYVKRKRISDRAHKSMFLCMAPPFLLFLSKIRTLLWVTVNKTWKYSRLPITRTFKGNRKKVWVKGSLGYREFEENSRE